MFEKQHWSNKKRKGLLIYFFFNSATTTVSFVLDGNRRKAVWMDSRAVDPAAPSLKHWAALYSTGGQDT